MKQLWLIEGQNLRNFLDRLAAVEIPVVKESGYVFILNNLGRIVVDFFLLLESDTKGFIEVNSEVTAVFQEFIVRNDFRRNITLKFLDYQVFLETLQEAIKIKDSRIDQERFWILEPKVEESSRKEFPWSDYQLKLEEKLLLEGQDIINKFPWELGFFNLLKKGKCFPGQEVLAKAFRNFVEKKRTWLSFEHLVKNCLLEEKINRNFYLLQNGIVWGKILKKTSEKYLVLLESAN